MRTLGKMLMILVALFAVVNTIKRAHKMTGIGKGYTLLRGFNLIGAFENCYLIPDH